MTDGIWEMNAISIFKAGGPLMWPILICSIFSMTILLDKMRYYTSIKGNTYNLKKQVFELIKANKIKEAVQICEASPTPSATVLKAGLVKFGCSKDEIRESIEATSLFEIPKLEARLSLLGTIAHVAPLLGFLGTATGLVNVFYTIQSKSLSVGNLTPADLGAGIAEALLTTVFGLLVAIPTFIAYNYCVNRSNQVILDMEQASSELINFMSHLTDVNA